MFDLFINQEMRNIRRQHHISKEVILDWSAFVKGREPNTAAALASQPAAGHSLSLFYYYHFMTLGWGLLVGPAAEKCSQIWLPRLMSRIRIRM